MLAVKLAFQRSPVSLVAHHVELFTDNMTVKAYLEKQGGTVSPTLNLITAEIWEWIEAHNVTLSLQHISGDLNVLADMLSRPHQVIQGEWELDQTVFQRICQMVPTIPDIDLFATRFNHKLDNYVSPCPAEFAVDRNALALKWNSYEFPYLFPPFSLIPDVLEKVRQENMTCLLVAPAWNTNQYYPLLLDLLMEMPISLGNGRGLLGQGPPQHRKFYPDPRALRLHAWIISGNESRVEDFRRLWHHERQSRSGFLPPHGTSTCGNNTQIGWTTTGEAILSRSLLP
jgi:hypothetical protein